MFIIVKNFSYKKQFKMVYSNLSKTSTFIKKAIECIWY